MSAQGIPSGQPLVYWRTSARPRRASAGEYARSSRVEPAVFPPIICSDGIMTRQRLKAPTFVPMLVNGANNAALVSALMSLRAREFRAFGMLGRGRRYPELGSCSLTITEVEIDLRAGGQGAASSRAGRACPSPARSETVGELEDILCPSLAEHGCKRALGPKRLRSAPHL